MWSHREGPGSHCSISLLLQTEIVQVDWKLLLEIIMNCYNEEIEELHQWET